MKFLCSKCGAVFQEMEKCEKHEEKCTEILFLGIKTTVLPKNCKFLKVKLHNRRVFLGKEENGWMIFTKTLYGPREINTQKIVFSNEAMSAIISMYIRHQNDL